MLNGCCRGHMRGHAHTDCCTQAIAHRPARCAASPMSSVLRRLQLLPAVQLGACVITQSGKAAAGGARIACVWMPGSLPVPMATLLMLCAMPVMPVAQRWRSDVAGMDDRLRSDW